MVASTVAISAASCSPNPSSACTPTIRQMPAIPANTPNSFRKPNVSWRVTASVRKNVKIGDVELRIVARPASSERSPQAISVQGITLLRHACNRKRPQVATSPGILSPRQRMIASSNNPAIEVRAAIRVIGGMVATPSLMNVYDPPHSVASSRSSRKSTAMMGFREGASSMSAVPMLEPPSVRDGKLHGKKAAMLRYIPKCVCVQPRRLCSGRAKGGPAYSASGERLPFWGLTPRRLRTPRRHSRPRAGCEADGRRSAWS
jgi:hypothetical protein